MESIKETKVKKTISIDKKIYEDLKVEFAGENFSGSIEKLFSEYKNLKDQLKNYDFKFLSELKLNQGIILNMLNSISLKNEETIFYGNRNERMSENFEKSKEAEEVNFENEKNIRLRKRDD
ncbi:hypothetical protein [Parvimonas micra]|jgi:hypothetical protein|uniref:hypothetical protein n=1 Tax=Parvimonas micra TaxID=33033 RepID=UPI0012399668|nr:hypothetical protein [Parvimonas micra]